MQFPTINSVYKVCVVSIDMQLIQLSFPIDKIEIDAVPYHTQSMQVPVTPVVRKTLRGRPVNAAINRCIVFALLPCP